MIYDFGGDGTDTQTGGQAEEFVGSVQGGYNKCHLLPLRPMGVVLSKSVLILLISH